MSMRRSTKAKKLQTQIALYYLGGRKAPRPLISHWSWSWQKGPEKFHISSKPFFSTGVTIKANHCDTCSCVEPLEGNDEESLCHTITYRDRGWGDRVSPDAQTPCKLCLKQLTKIAHEDD